MKPLKSILILLFALQVNAQDMQEGFTYLETGNYKKAETYFKTVLKNYPNNKTARLCYGRAIGLNGNPEASKSLFTNLLSDYPNDFEIKLNYGESLLWNKNYKEAALYFQKLLEEQPRSFSALLSYANTLSNLEEYENALIYVNKALKVSPGNLNALTSKKYMYLGYAYKKQKAQQYDQAEILLKENLKLFNNDKETLLNLGNLYIIINKFENAASIYHTLAKNPDNTIEALNGLALVSHLKGKEKEALKLSALAFKSLDTTINSILVQQTTERYIQALIWNKKYTSAKTQIDNLMQDLPNKNWLLALRATLNIYKSNFKKSIVDYNQILVNDSTSFDGNLGKANALKALGYYNEAFKSAKNTLKFYNKQKDATNFINQLNTTFTPFYEGKTSYSFDNGDNEAFSINNTIEFPLSTKFKLLGNYNYRSTNNLVTTNKATTNDASIGFAYKLLANLYFNGSIGLTSANTNSQDYSQFLTTISIKSKPFKLQDIEIGYKRELQSFNADLLNREIIQNHFYANYNVSSNFNLGWFTQYYYTSQNDGNTRNLLFSSVYYNLLSKPVLKAGLNYQYISFKNQVPSIYFSPKRFNAGEVFINIIKDENITKSKQWFYELTAATGLQYIEDNSSQSTYRFQGKLGYKFSERNFVNLFATRSNIASATAAGFTYTELGIRFKWLLFKKPLFRE